MKKVRLPMPTNCALLFFSHVGLLCFVGFPLVRADQPPALGIEEVAALQETAAAAIASFDVVYSVETKFLMVDDWEKTADGRRRLVSRSKVPPDAKPDSRVAYVHQIYDRGKERVEFLRGPDGPPVRIINFDGETERILTPPGRDGQIGKPEPFPTEEGANYRETFATFMGRIRLQTMIRERAKAGIVTFEDRSPDGVVVRSDPQPDRPFINVAGFGFQVVLDPAHGMHPKRVTRSKLVDKELKTVRVSVVSEWLQLDSKIWVPIELVTHFYDVDHRPTLGEPLLLNTLRVDKSKSKWNKPVPPGTFVLPFPAGTRVMDMIRQVEYTVGEKDTGHNLDALLANAKGKIDFEYAHANPRPSWSLYQLLLLCGSLVAIAVLAILSLAVVRKRHASKEAK